MSSHAEQHFHRELVELLVAETAAGERYAIDVLGKQCVAAAGRILTDRRGLSRSRFLQQRLDLLVGIPAFGALLENEIRAHAAAREVLDALVILGSIRVR